MQSILALYASQPLWVWLAVAALLLAAEVSTGSGWLLWPAATAAAVGIVAVILPLPLGWALGLFALLTLVATFASRRILPRKELEPTDDINDPLSRLIGRDGETASVFVGGEGRVFVDGKEWAARLSGASTLERGMKIEVVQVDGSVLTVRAG
ncbi:NfeD family protein [Caulobacter segnis]|uniref:NfeD family protein n=1 Tax=Caulobacter segnis TaxID=88688 RepID=UPI00240F6AA2|nr:NfeD family protein [Caulobacter segnis]MDG2520037.1 NfeD family protein [Caulobacter segnis]